MQNNFFPSLRYRKWLHQNVNKPRTLSPILGRENGGSRKGDTSTGPHLAANLSKGRLMMAGSEWRNSSGGEPQWQIPGSVDRSFRSEIKYSSAGARPVITKWRKKNTARHYWRSGSRRENIGSGKRKKKRREEKGRGLGRRAKTAWKRNYPR